MNKDELTQALYARLLNFKPSKGDLRKIAILENAIDCLATLGVEAMSFEAIGKPSAMTKAHVAYYFRDRKEITKAAIRFVVATVQNFTIESVKNAPDEGARLEAFVDGTFRWLETYPKHAPVILLLYYYASFDPFFREMHAEIREFGARRLEAIVEPMLPKKSRRQAHVLAKLVQTILTGTIIDHFTTRSPVDLDELRKRTLKEIEIVVGAFTGADS